MLCRSMGQLRQFKGALLQKCAGDCIPRCRTLEYHMGKRGDKGPAFGVKVKKGVLQIFMEGI